MADRVRAWYIPGWMRCYATDDEALRVASSIFGDGNVASWDWDGNVHWKQAVANADAAVSRIVAEIAGMSEELRNQLVLVGHSLGGRIVARALAQLADRGLRIRQGILLGAAIRDDDSDLLRMGNGSGEPVWVICNPDDNMLKYVYATVGGEGGAALGTNGSAQPLSNCREMAVPQDIVQQTEIAAAWGVNDAVKEIANHYAVFYLSYVRMIRRNDERQGERSLVLQDLPNMELKVANAGIWWKTIEVWENWQLQRHVLTGHFRNWASRSRRVGGGRVLDLRCGVDSAGNSGDGRQRCRCRRAIRTGCRIGCLHRLRRGVCAV